MYPLKEFKITNGDEVMDFMRRYPFVTLVGSGENASTGSAQAPLVATHVPVLIKEVDDKLILEGHFMHSTDHGRAFQKNPNALVIFNGPNCYVSSSWYTEMSASTWNYMTVHARGEIKFLDENELQRILTETTNYFESNSDSPLTFDKLPEDYINGMIKMIVAFQIEVQSLENVFKLSQNRNEQSYKNIIAELKKRGGENALVADEMERRNR